MILKMLLLLMGTWHLLRQHLLVLGQSSSVVQSLIKPLTAVGDRPIHSPGLPDDITPTETIPCIQPIE